MLNKLFSFLGFNSGNTVVGLHGLADNSARLQKVPKLPKKELKLSDLMRGQ